MDGLAGGGVEAVEGEAEEGAIRFAGPGIGGGEDVLEKRAGPEAGEDGGEAVVEIGDHRRGSELRGLCEEGEHLREEHPGVRIGVMSKERLEVGIESGEVAGGKPAGRELGGLAAQGLQDGGDEITPPGVFGSVAEGVKGVIGGGRRAQGVEKSGLHAGGLDRDAGRGGEVAGVGPTHRFGGLDEGTDSVEEESHGVYRVG